MRAPPLAPVFCCVHVTIAVPGAPVRPPRGFDPARGMRCQYPLLSAHERATRPSRPSSTDRYVLWSLACCARATIGSRAHRLNCRADSIPRAGCNACTRCCVPASARRTGSAPRVPMGICAPVYVHLGAWCILAFGAFGAFGALGHRCVRCIGASVHCCIFACILGAKMY